MSISSGSRFSSSVSVHADPMSYDIGDEVNSYIVGDLLGRGAFGVVYRVSDYIGTIYAMKVSNLYALGREYGVADSIIKETMILKQNDHPNVISIHDLFVLDDYIHLILPIADRSLYDWIYSFGGIHIDVPLTKRFMYQLYCGLEYLSKRSVIHADIKPQNILMFGDTIKIADFGISVLCSRAECPISRDIGTSWYRAPELITDTIPRMVTTKFDVWSAGCTLFEMIYKTPLFPYSVSDIKAKSEDEIHEMIETDDIKTNTPFGQDVQDAFSISMVTDQAYRATATEVLDVLDSQEECEIQDTEIRYPDISAEHSNLRRLTLNNIYELNSSKVPNYRELWLVAIQICDSYLNLVTREALNVRLGKTLTDERLSAILAEACSLITKKLIDDNKLISDKDFITESYIEVLFPTRTRRIYSMATFIVDINTLELDILTAIRFKIDYPTAIVKAVIDDETITFGSRKMYRLLEYMKNLRSGDIVEYIRSRRF